MHYKKFILLLFVTFIFFYKSMENQNVNNNKINCNDDENINNLLEYLKNKECIVQQENQDIFKCNEKCIILFKNQLQKKTYCKLFLHVQLINETKKHDQLLKIITNSLWIAENNFEYMCSIYQGSCYNSNNNDDDKIIIIKKWCKFYKK